MEVAELGFLPILSTNFIQETVYEGVRQSQGSIEVA
jgi:hypothetical protein